MAAAAKYIDGTYSQPGTGASVIRVTTLRNTFVNDRVFSLRDAPITIPGVATVLNQLLNNGKKQNSANITLSGFPVTAQSEVRDLREGEYLRRMGDLLPVSNGRVNPQTRQDDMSNSTEGNAINIVAYTDTNSLLIQGTEKQVAFVEDLVSAIDITKQQIQLSLWIIDISKDDIENLGVAWQG